MARIMIVDDSDLDRRVIVRFLTHSGHDVYEARNGLDALQMYQVVMPDLVLMDLYMQRMGGVVALAGIRDLDPDARVVMVTASGERSEVSRAIENGAMDYILKPFEPEVLLDTVHRLTQGL